MVIELILGILIVGIIIGTAFMTKVNWSVHMARNMGKKRMEEYGLDNENKEYHK